MSKFWYGDEPSSYGASRWVEFGKNAHILMPTFPKVSRDISEMIVSTNKSERDNAAMLKSSDFHLSLQRRYMADPYAGADDITCDCKYFFTDEGSS